MLHLQKINQTIILFSHMIPSYWRGERKEGLELGILSCQKGNLLSMNPLVLWVNHTVLLIPVIYFIFNNQKTLRYFLQHPLTHTIHCRFLFLSSGKISSVRHYESKRLYKIMFAETMVNVQSSYSIVGPSSQHSS